MADKKYKAIFFGTPQFAVPSLETLAKIRDVETVAVVTQPDRPVGRSQRLTPPPVKQAARQKNIAVLQPLTITSNEFADQIRAHRPDVAVIVAYGKIIPEALLNIPAHGWINIHASLLPKLRGASPIQTAILQGFQVTGVTMMRIEPTLDTGPSIAQESIRLEPADTFITLHDKLARLGAALLSQALLPYLEGTLRPVAQNDAEATYCSPIRKEDGKINWRLPASQIERQIRAFTPWPGTWTVFEGITIKIRSAKISSAPVPVQKPGWLECTEGALRVVTGEGTLEIGSVQLAGKKPMSAQEFINGYRAQLPAQLQLP